MNMKVSHIPAILLLTALVLACNGKNDPDNGGGNGGADFWSHAKPLVSMVEVSSDGTLLETYEFTYDDKGHILTLVKTDKLSGEVLLNLRYTYPSENEMRATGRFTPLSSNRFITAVYDPGTGALTYNGSWSDAWKYATSLGGDGHPNSTECDPDFSAPGGEYNSDIYYSEAYTLSDGSISTAVIGTETKAQSRRATRSAGSTALTVSYSYAGQEDRQNFAAYLMPCSFPVWVASGLPGNKKLIKGISSKTGDVPAPETTLIDYSFTPEGDIDTATRTDSNAGSPVLVRTYKFYYQ